MTKVNHKDVEASFHDITHAMIMLEKATSKTFTSMSNLGRPINGICEICGEKH